MANKSFLYIIDMDDNIYDEAQQLAKHILSSFVKSHNFLSHNVLHFQHVTLTPPCPHSPTPLYPFMHDSPCPKTPRPYCTCRHMIQIAYSAI